MKSCLSVKTEEEFMVTSTCGLERFFSIGKPTQQSDALYQDPWPDRKSFAIQPRDQQQMRLQTSNKPQSAVRRIRFDSNSDMVAGGKKKAQKKRVSAGPTTMEGQDPRQSLLEVPEESLHRQPPPVGPRMESAGMEVILQLLKEVFKDTKQLRAAQESLLSEVAEIRASINQMNQWLDLAESRFSSLEDRACETHQTSSIMSVSQCDPRAASAASSPSFSSQPKVLDVAQMAASPRSASVYTGGASTGPAPPSASEQFRTASSTLVYCKNEKKARRMLADTWSQERTSESETVHIEAEESNQQDISGESPLTSSKYKADRQPLTSNLPETPQPPSPGKMQKETPLTATQLSRRCPTNKRSGSSASASTTTSAGTLGHVVSSPPTEGMSPTKRPRASIAWCYFTKHPTSKFIATCKMCGKDVKTGKVGGCGKVGTSALLKHMKCVHDIAWEKAPSVSPAAVPKIQTMGRPSTVERPSRSTSAALACTTTSAVTRRSLALSPPAEVMSPAKHPRTSIAWRYFTKHPTSKFIATCKICRVNVKTGKIGGCGKVGTASLLSHIKRIHHIVLKK